MVLINGTLEGQHGTDNNNNKKKKNNSNNKLLIFSAVRL